MTECIIPRVPISVWHRLLLFQPVEPASAVVLSLLCVPEVESILHFSLHLNVLLFHPRLQPWPWLLCLQPQCWCLKWSSRVPPAEWLTRPRACRNRLAPSRWRALISEEQSTTDSGGMKIKNIYVVIFTLSWPGFTWIFRALKLSFLLTPVTSEILIPEISTMDMI